MGAVQEARHLTEERIREFYNEKGPRRAMNLEDSKRKRGLKENLSGVQMELTDPF